MSGATLLDTNLVGEASRQSARQYAPARVLILGVGNLLMGDEGIGIHIVRQLERMDPIDGTRLLDGGTGGIDLLEHILTSPHVVLVDATRDGCRAGTFKQFRAATPKALPQGLSAHDFGLKDLFAAAAVLGRMPNIHLVTVSVESVKPMCMDLSPEVAAVLPKVVDAVRYLAARLAEQEG